jgi:hypothetical protein
VSAGIAIKTSDENQYLTYLHHKLCAIQLAIKKVRGVEAFHDFYSSLVGIDFL